MTVDKVRALLRKRCEASGGQSKWAKESGVSSVYVTDVLVGRKEPGPAICRALGLERVVTYRKVKSSGG